MGGLAVLAVASLAAVVTREVDLSSSPSQAASLPTLGQIVSESTRALSGADTPQWGASSGVLGYGDSAGGRPLIPYLDKQTQGAAAPVFNSIIDVPWVNGTHFEPTFLHVAAVPLREVDRSRPIQRAVRLQPGAALVLNVYVENSAYPEANCSRLAGPSVAYNSRLRVAVWDSPNREFHVFRAWLYAKNAKPAWVTDAVGVLTSRPGGFMYDHSRSREVSLEPKIDHALSYNDAVNPGGMSLGYGATGLIGSCWNNRVYIGLVFTQR